MLEIKASRDDKGARGRDAVCTENLDGGGGHGARKVGGRRISTPDADPFTRICGRFARIFCEKRWGERSEGLDEGGEAFSVFDVGVVALLPVDEGGVGGVEDGGDVGFDGDEAGVGAGEGVGEDFAEHGVAFAGHGVFGFELVADGVFAVFDVDVDDVVADGLPEFEGVLPGEGLGL